MGAHNNPFQFTPKKKRCLLGERREAFEKMKNIHRNETVAEIVRNQNETHRIIEKDGRLIQKIFPIYKNPDPNHMLDYRSQFYVPQKHFLGIQALYMFRKKVLSTLPTIC